MIELTRCYRFPAAHVLARDDFSDAENQRRYGKCANPGGHGHNYGVEVTVRGPVDPGTGEVMGRRQLDELVAERVVARFGHRLLNDDPLFEGRVPTAENIARAISRRHQDRGITGPARSALDANFAATHAATRFDHLAHTEAPTGPQVEAQPLAALDAFESAQVRVAQIVDVHDHDAVAGRKTELFEIRHERR